jgi:prolipoprotein diacylglyceryltransferase
VAGRRAEKEKIPREVIQDLTIWLFLGGLLGARILHMLMEAPWPNSFGDFLWQLPQIWEGGIILYGSVLGALVSYTVAYWLVFRKQGYSTLKLADIIAPSIALGICLGRIGCFLNGCCYGQVVCPDCATVGAHFPLSAPARYALVEEGYQTAAGFTFAGVQQQFGTGVKVGQVDPDSAAWRAGLRPDDVIVTADGKKVDTPEMLSAYLASFRNWPRGKTDLSLEVKGKDQPLTFVPRTLGLYPTQLYESISMLLLFLFLTAYYPFRYREGQVMAVLMICYGIHRWLNEILRDDARPKGFESYTSVILIGCGAALWGYLYLRNQAVHQERKGLAVAGAH